MKRVLIIVLVVVGVLAAAVVGGAIWFQSQGSHRVLDQAQTVLQKQGWELYYAGNRLQWIPMRWVIAGVTLQNKDKTIFAKISQMELAIGWNWSALTNPAEPLLDLRVDLESPDLLLRQSDTLSPETQTRAGAPGAAGESSPPPIPPRDVSLRVQLSRAQVRTSEGADGYLIKEGELQFSVPSIKNLIQNMHNVRPAQAPSDFSGHARWVFNIPQLNLPFSAQWEGSMDRSRVQLGKIQVYTLGVGLSAAGWLDHVSGHQNWAARAQVVDVSKIPSGAMDLPFQFTAGRFDLNVKAQKINEWQAEGTLNLQDLTLNASYKEKAASAQGPIAVQGRFQFSYANNVLNIPPFELKADLSQAEIAYSDLFHKRKGLSSLIEVQGSSQPDRVELTKLQGNIGSFSIRTRGQIQNPTEKGPFQAQIEIPLTSAESLRQFLPPLKSAPIQGQVRTQIQLNGSLDHFEKSKYQVTDLLLKQVMGKLTWKSEDATTELQGEFAMDAQVQAAGTLEKVDQASGTLFADLSRMTIRKSDLFQKPAGVLLQAKTQFRLNEEQVQLQETWARLAGSRLDLNGAIQGFETPRLQLTLGARPLQLKELSERFPLLKEYDLSGEIQGAVQLNGTYNPKLDMFDQPIAVQGELSARIPQYKISKSEEEEEKAAGSGGGSGAGGSSEPVLPKKPLIQKSGIKYQAQIDELHYDDLKVRGLFTRGELKAGVMSGTARITQLFGGSIQVKSYRWNLIQPRSPIEAEIQAINLDLTQTMGWLAPRWKQSLGGSLQGEMKLAMRYPLSQSPMDDFNVSGSAQVQNFKAHTKPITEMIQESLAQIPGLSGGDVIRDSTLNARLETRFSLEKGDFQLRTFQILTSQNDELHLSGVLKKDESIRLNGTAFLAKVPVKGSVRAANSDEKGRLILPLGLTGTLSSPKPQITEKTLQTLLSKTVQMETTKARAQLQKQVSKEAERVKADLKDDLEKKAKNLMDQFLNKKKKE